MFAAAPTWLDGNVAWASLFVLLLVAVAVLRFVQKTRTRVALLVVLGLGAGLVLSERTELEQCGSTCECEPAGVHVSVPFCDPF